MKGYKTSESKLVALFYGKNGELIAKHTEGEPTWYLNEDVRKAFESNLNNTEKNIKSNT